MTFQGILLGVLIVVLIINIAEVYFPDHEEEMIERIKALKLYSAPTEVRKRNESLFARIYQSIEEWIVRKFGNQISKGGSLAPLRVKLTQAGMGDIDPVQHRAKRLIFALGFSMAGMPSSDYKIIVMAAVIGFIFPDYQLKKRIDERKFQIKDEIPDFLDLLAATFPGSSGFEDAVKKICDRSSGVVASEFRRVLEEINAGRRKRDALKSMAARCGVTEIDSLIGQVIQSDMLGTGLEGTLKTQSDKLRGLKKQNAEIKARRASVTLLLPSIFLLVSILIVVAGPSIVQFLEVMGGM